jgi:recombination associated protein RdgC
MWFKNLITYRLKPTGLTSEILTAALEKHPLQEIGQTDVITRGWMPVHNGGPLVLSVAGHHLVCLGITSRQVPGSVVHEAALKKAAEIEAQQGFKPGRVQMREIKEAIIGELLPRAFPRTRRLFAWIDTTGGWLGIDAPGLALAEQMLDALRDTLDELPVAMIKTTLSTISAMTAWVASTEAPGNFTVDMDVRLVSVTDGGSAINYTATALDHEEIRTQLARGYLAERLALTWNDRVSFLLNDKLIIKRLGFLDTIKEQAERDAESAGTQAEADFALMSGELSQLVPALVEALGGEMKDEVA